jgi:cobalt-zinc-cadmium efflux system protein
LILVLGLTGIVLIGEVVGSILSGSLALLADAGHMATDSAGLVLALLATRLATRAPTVRRTFGFQRAEVLAALVNGLLVLAVGLVVTIEGIQRTINPGEVESRAMLIVAGVGLVANVAGLVILRKGSQESLNIRGAYLEVLGDALGSVAVIAAGVVMATTGWMRADGVASLVLGLLIAPRAVSLLRDVAHVLLEGTPRGVDLEAVRAHIEQVDGVVAAHDLHAWTITSGVPALTAHVVVEDRLLTPSPYHALLDHLRDCLAGHFDLDHSTFQIEPRNHHEQAAHA